MKLPKKQPAGHSRVKSSHRKQLKKSKLFSFFIAGMYVLQKKKKFKDGIRLGSDTG